jgi:hypothetical protein
MSIRVYVRASLPAFVVRSPLDKQITGLTVGHGSLLIACMKIANSNQHCSAPSFFPSEPGVRCRKHSQESNCFVQDAWFKQSNRSSEGKRFSCFNRGRHANENEVKRPRSANARRTSGLPLAVRLRRSRQESPQKHKSRML